MFKRWIWKILIESIDYFCALELFVCIFLLNAHVVKKIYSLSDDFLELEIFGTMYFLWKMRWAFWGKNVLNFGKIRCGFGEKLFEFWEKYE